MVALHWRFGMERILHIFKCFQMFADFIDSVVGEHDSEDEGDPLADFLARAAGRGRGRGRAGRGRCIRGRAGGRSRGYAHSVETLERMRAGHARRKAAALASHALEVSAPTEAVTMEHIPSKAQCRMRIPVRSEAGIVDVVVFRRMTSGRDSTVATASHMQAVAGGLASWMEDVHFSHAIKIFDDATMPMRNSMQSGAAGVLLHSLVGWPFVWI